MAASPGRSYSPEYLERLSSPDYLAGDESLSDSQSVAKSDHRPNAAAPLSADEDRMNSDSPAPSQERSPVGSDSNEENPPLKRFKGDLDSYYESSDDCIPPNRPQTSPIDGDSNEEPASSKHSKTDQINYYDSTSAPPSKPPKKNLPIAKESIIHQIQHHWGPNFIKSFIPKCHRPLVKSATPKRKRKSTSPRKHESNPHNWTPSSLTSMLRIAKLTSDKTWLHKAMRDVVRHRIRHTGNRKPQLGRADFDIIEDMLGKGWGVQYAFGVRYKHLVKEEEEGGEGDDDEEDVEYLFDAGPDSSEEEEEEEEEEEGESEEVQQKKGRGTSGKGKKQSKTCEEVHISSSSSSPETINPYQHVWCKSRYGMFPPLPHASSSAHSAPQAAKHASAGTQKTKQKSTTRGDDAPRSQDDSLFVPEGTERDGYEEFEEEEEEQDYEAEIAAAKAELKLARLRAAAAKANKLKRKK
ncbi:hypothetical protein J3E74DRAFT_412936 [Bipolaris maydis]|nr:hypothetical protein J3E74DRAFT_412936 [Bipolaris maydis]